MTDPPTLRKQVVCASMSSPFIYCYIKSITTTNLQSNEKILAPSKRIQKKMQASEYWLNVLNFPNSSLTPIKFIARKEILFSFC